MDTASKTTDTKTQIVGDYYLPPEQLAFRIGRSLIGLKLHDNAIKEFEKGFRHNPNDTGCIIGMANVAFHFKKFEESHSLLIKALEIEPENKEIQSFIKQVETTIGKLETKDSKKTEAQISQGEIKQKPLLSLSMIEKNEESMLPGCLESVKEVVDEIVIVDTGSSDRTKEIARSFGAKIIDFEWVNDFAAARNESLRNCTGEWILYLDADERLKDLIRIEVYGLSPDVGRGTQASISLTLAKAEDVLVLPRGMIRSYLGRRYVQVLNNGVREERDVQLGLESATEVEIVEGLKEGEEVIIG